MLYKSVRWKDTHQHRIKNRGGQCKIMLVTHSPLRLVLQSADAARAWPLHLIMILLWEKFSRALKTELFSCLFVHTWQMPCCTVIRNGLHSCSKPLNCILSWWTDGQALPTCVPLSELIHPLVQDTQLTAPAHSDKTMSHQPIELALFVLSKHFACQLGMGLLPACYRMESECFKMQTDGKGMSAVAELCLMAKKG